MQGIEKLCKLKYGVNTMAIKGGLTIGVIEKFLAAVNKTRGTYEYRHDGSRWQHKHGET